MLGRLFFLIQECWLNFRRQGLMALTCISTSAIALSILGVFTILAWHVHAVAEAIPRQFEVHAFVQPGTATSETQMLAASIRRLAGVARVVLVPKEQAWAEYRKHYARPDDMEGMENPLPDKVEITATTPEQTLEVAKQVRAFPHVDEVRGGEEVLRRLLAIAGGVRVVGIVLVLLLSLGTVAIISNAIKITLFARRRDIRVMQLVGATNGFIRTPFLLEGMLEGAAGGLIACGLLAAAMQYFTRSVLPSMTLVKELQVSLDMPLFCAFLVFAGVLFGILGSILSLRRFLRPA